MLDERFSANALSSKLSLDLLSSQIGEGTLSHRETGEIERPARQDRIDVSDRRARQLAMALAPVLPCLLSTRALGDDA